MQAGIQLSQTLQRAIVYTGTTIIDDRLVKTLQNFRLIVLKESPDLYLFLHPLTLSKLAMFMITTMRETGKSHLPLVIAALDASKDEYLVIGMEYERGVDSRQK